MFSSPFFLYTTLSYALFFVLFATLWVEVIQRCDPGVGSCKLPYPDNLRITTWQPGARIGKKRVYQSCFMSLKIICLTNLCLLVLAVRAQMCAVLF